MRSRRICPLHFDVVCASPEGAQVHRLASRKAAPVDIIGRDPVFSLTRRHLEQSVTWFSCADGACPRAKGNLLEITFHTGALASAALATRTACQQSKQQTQSQSGPAANSTVQGTKWLIGFQFSQCCSPWFSFNRSKGSFASALGGLFTRGRGSSGAGPLGRAVSDTPRITVEFVRMPDVVLVAVECISTRIGFDQEPVR